MPDLDVRVVLSAVNQGFTSGLQSASNTLNQFGERAGTVSSNVPSALKKVGASMMATGTAITAMGVKSIKSYGQFEQSLNQAAVVAGGTAKDINGLSEVANKMGADLPIDAQQAAEAMVEMARNGASVGQIKQQFPAIAQAATAAGADIKATAGTVQESMNIWGNSLKSPQQAAAILVQTANASNASIEDMGQALATIGGTASNANISMQVIAESIGLLTNKGFSAAQASLDLNHAIMQMQAPSKMAKNAMTELGISFVDSEGKLKQFPQILSELNKAMANLSPDEKAKKLKAMFGQSGMQAILPLMDSVKNKTNDAKVSWDAYAREQEKASGSTKKATASLKDQANEMQKNIGSSIEQLGGNWESLRNKSMQSVQNINGAMIASANNMLTWATNSNSATAQFIRGFIGLSPAIGSAVNSIGMFLFSFKQIASATSMVAKGFGALFGFLASNPFVAIIAGITLVVAGLTWFFTQTKTGRAMWASFVSWLKGLWQGLVQIATTVWNAIVQVWNGAVGIIRGVWNGVLTVTRTVWNAIRAYISTVFNNIQIVIRTRMTVIRTIFSAGWRILTTIVSAVWKIITTIVSGAINAVAGIIRAITAVIRGDWSGAWNAIKGVVQTVWDTIKSVVQTGINAVQSIVTTVMNAVKGVFSSVWNAIRDVFNNGVNFIKSVMHIDLFAQGQAIMNSLLNGLKSIWENVKNFVGGIGNWIKEHKGPLSYDEQLLIPAGQAIMGGLFNGLNNGFGNVQDLISSIAQSVASNVTDVMDNANSLLSDSRLELPEVSSQKFNDSLNNLNSQLQTNIMGQISISNNNTMARTNQLLERIANKDNTMVLDTGKVVAETTGQYNDSLGEQVARRDRWS